MKAKAREAGARKAPGGLSPDGDDVVAMSRADIRELKAREASFRLLFDGNPIAAALCDPESFDFLAVNDAAAALWGFPRAALAAMSLYDVAPKEDWDDMRRRARQAPLRPVEERAGVSCGRTAA